MSSLTPNSLLISVLIWSAIFLIDTTIATNSDSNNQHQQHPHDGPHPPHGGGGGGGHRKIRRHRPIQDANYKCKANQALAVLVQQPHLIIMDCVPTFVCGEKRTCNGHVPGPAVLTGQYVFATDGKPKDLQMITCQVPHSSHHHGDDCRILTLQRNASMHAMHPGSGPHGSPKDGSHKKDSHRQQQELGVRAQRIIGEYRSNYLSGVYSYVKSIKFYSNAMVVTACTPQCDRTSTVTHRVTPTPTPKPRQDDNAKQPFRLFPRAPGSGGASCFSGDTTVITKHGNLRMDQLKVGTEVLVTSTSSEQAFQPVEWFYHKDPRRTETFVKITTRSGRQLRLSVEHMIPVVPCSQRNLNETELQTFVNSQSIFAKYLAIGYCLASIDDNGQTLVDQIIDLDEEEAVGVFSPITSHGTIVVNRLLSSCYSSLQNQPLQHFFHLYLIRLGRLSNSVWNWIYPEKSESFWIDEDTGVPLVLKVLLRVAKFTLPQSILSGLSGF